MESESAVSVLLFVAVIVIFFFLIAAKAIIFFRDLHNETSYCKAEVRRAQNEAEYRYWLKELRCRYLCIIPFVTERNVMRVYRLFFHKAKHAKKKERNDAALHVLASSLIGICICAVCLCGMSWAWFTATAGTAAKTIKTPQYKLTCSVFLNGAEVGGAAHESGGTEYRLNGGKYTVVLKAAGTGNATGYCKVKIGETTYYTEQIFANGEFSFYINAGSEENIVLTPSWGTCAAVKNGNAVTDKEELAAGKAVLANDADKTQKAPETELSGETPALNTQSGADSAPEETSAESTADGEN